MKRSKEVQLVLLSIIVASLCGCSKKQDLKHCVDENDTVVDESNCDKPTTEANGSSGSTSSPRMHRWYYGGTTVYNPGSRVSGGSYVPTPSRTYSAPSTISRGGFGSIGGGVSAGAGE